MSQIVVYELMDSMSGSLSNESEGGETREVNRRFVIGQCTTGFNEVIDEIKPYAPEYCDTDGTGLYWVRRRVTVAPIGNAYFDVTATYQTLQPKKPPDQQQDDYTPGSMSWDTSGHTEHITQAKAEQRIPATAPSYERAINVSGESVQGLDVVRPNLRYSETWMLPVEIAINCDFIGAVYRLTGTVNADQFRCFDPGEALFMGARGQWSGDQPYISVTFDWECRPNSEVYPFPGAGEAFQKKGWEYIWLKYETDADGDSLVRTATAAYKDKVYDEESWDDLGFITKTIGAPQTGAIGQGGQAGGNGIT